MTRRQPQPGRRGAATRIPLALADAIRRSIDRQSRGQAGHRRHGTRERAPASAPAQIRQAVSGALTAIRRSPGHPDHGAAGSLLAELVAYPPGPRAQHILSLASWQVLAAENRQATHARRQTLRQLERVVRDPGRRPGLAGLIERILPAAPARLHVSTDRNGDAVIATGLADAAAVRLHCESGGNVRWLERGPAGARVRHGTIGTLPGPALEHAFARVAETVVQVPRGAPANPTASAAGARSRPQPAPAGRRRKATP